MSDRQIETVSLREKRHTDRHKETDRYRNTHTSRQAHSQKEQE